MRTSKFPSAYCRVAWAISRMGCICRMVVTEDAMKDTISTTNAVMKNKPIKPFHMLSSDAVVETAKTSPTVSRLSGFTAATPTTNRFFSYSPPRSSRWEVTPFSMTSRVMVSGMVTTLPSRALSVESSTCPSVSQIMKCTSDTMAAKEASC